MDAIRGHNVIVCLLKVLLDVQGSRPLCVMMQPSTSVCKRQSCVLAHKVQSVLKATFGRASETNKVDRTHIL